MSQQFYLISTDKPTLDSYQSAVNAQFNFVPPTNNYADVEVCPNQANLYRFNVGFQYAQMCALDYVAAPAGASLVWIPADDPLWTPPPVGP